MNFVKISRNFVDRFWYKNRSTIDSPPGIGSDPADILAPPEAPVLEAQPAQVQAVARAAPQEHKAAAGAHLRHQKYLVDDKNI